MSAELLRSALTVRQFSPISLAVASSFFWSRPLITTFAPSRAKARAMARPIPLPPPVTMATLFANRMAMIVNRTLRAKRRHRACAIMDGGQTQKNEEMNYSEQRQFLRDNQLWAAGLALLLVVAAAI